MERFLRRIKSAFENKLLYQTFKLSYVATLSVVVSNIHNLFGTVMVGHVGADSVEQVSAMGVALIILLLFSSPMNSFGSASQSIISRFWGAGDRKQALISFKSAMIASFIVSVILSALVFIIGDKIIAISSTNSKVRDYAMKFLMIRVIGFPFSAVSFVIRGFFDAIGKPKEHLKFNLYSTLVCIILSPFFIFGIFFPRLELYGFALASSISGFVAMFLGLVYVKDYIFQNFSVDDIKQESYLKILTSFLFKNLKVSIPALGAQFIAVTTFILFMRASESEGVEHQAATFILVNIISLFLLPSFAIGTTLAAFCGRLIGDGKTKKAKKIIYDAVIVVAVFASFISLIFFLFSYQIIDGFSNDDMVIDVGGKVMRIFSPGLFFLVSGMILINTLIGIGDTKFVIILEFIAHFLILIPSLIFVGIFLRANSIYIWLIVSLYFAIVFSASFIRLNKLEFKEI
ncbi:MAG: MATE family efflux transporter [Candidatus Calescibacterium sp.]|nr:MATE family efflux transporter [Candidatus Calescibacterium sp.]MCX7733984.1 MATE family efflux transporter [bacterium]MDW8086417.1 MATE family efflux transporter [Candidatus Calescibacterium sp.]